MLRATGTLLVTHGKVAVEMDRDFTDYYAWFLEREYWIRFQTPLHGSHITVINRRFHGDKIDWKGLKKLHKRKITFDYDPDIIRGGFTKGFIMFYLRVFSDELDKIKKEYGASDGDNYKGLHITVANAGKSGSKIVDYWPQMIKIESK